jgi:thymidylate kinase
MLQSGSHFLHSAIPFLYTIEIINLLFAIIGSMPLIYITGPTGAGKTTIRNELRKRGYEAHDTDEGINGHFNVVTGQEVPYPNPEDVNPEWISQHRYIMSEDRIRNLHEAAKDKAIFVCGAAYNDLEMFPYFDKTICLIVDKARARERIETRTTNNFGKLPAEMESIMDRHDSILEKYSQAGCELVDTAAPLDDVLNAILKIAI